MRIGHGYDVHKLVKDRKLVLGGCKINYPFGLLGHSDADVLVHSIMDALLGAAALCDIGNLFPDNDPKYKDASSLTLLKNVCERIHNEGYNISNIDCTIIAQEPKLTPYIPSMRSNIAHVCNIDESQINIKATTEEHLGFTGKLQGISAHAVCLLV